MNGAEKVVWEHEEMESVFLSCLRCGKTEVIKVHRKRKFPRKVFWECRVCLNEDLRSGMRPVV